MQYKFPVMGLLTPFLDYFASEKSTRSPLSQGLGNPWKQGY
ncbi:MAG: hypothetical protein AAGA86_00110 [Bacteroidota bacterium]